MQRSGLDRARWLAELAEALGTARRLAAQIEIDPAAHANGAALKARLTQAIAEVEALRRGGRRRFGENVDPNRLKLPPERRNSRS